MTAPTTGTARPRILIVSASGELYGSDRSLLDALPELCASFDPVLLLPGDGPAVDAARARGAEVVVLPDFALRRRSLTAGGWVGWSCRLLHGLRAARRLHRQAPFDLVYSNTLAAGLGVLVAGVLRLPHVLHVRETVATPRLLGLALVRTAAWATDTFICNSRHVRDWVVAVAPELHERTVVIHNGVPPRPASPAPRTKLFHVVCVARLHPHKGQTVLLEAFRKLREQGVEAHLSFCGDALPEHRWIEDSLRQEVARTGLGGRVHLRGYVPDVIEQYADADVAVVPSTHPEPFSRVCLEAQALGLPVIATSPGGPQEIVVQGVTGLLVPTGDAPALAAALQRLARDPDARRRMGAAGRARVRSAFAVEVYARRVRAVCEAATEAPGGASPPTWSRSGQGPGRSRRRIAAMRLPSMRRLSTSAGISLSGSETARPRSPGAVGLIGRAS